jgi:hypothetical protein
LFDLSTDHDSILDHFPVENKDLLFEPAVSSLPSRDMVLAIPVPGVSDPLFWRKWGRFWLS